jgi:hypothetical protein
LQSGILLAYEKKGQGLTEFSNSIMSLMELGMSRERALVQLALENNIEIEEVKELEKRGLSREEATREFVDKMKTIQDVYSSTSSEPVTLSPSAWWYLLPLFFGILGGIIAYVYVKDGDSEMAKDLFLVGVIPTIIIIIFGWILLSMLLFL